MSEYSHGDFPCEPRANTPEFNKGYEGMKWDDDHDDLGRVVKKQEDECGCLQWGMLPGEKYVKDSHGKKHNRACGKFND